MTYFEQKLIPSLDWSIQNRIVSSITTLKLIC